MRVYTPEKRFHKNYHDHQQHCSASGVADNFYNYPDRNVYAFPLGRTHSVSQNEGLVRSFIPVQTDYNFCGVLFSYPIPIQLHHINTPCNSGLIPSSSDYWKTLQIIFYESWSYGMLVDCYF